MCVLPPAPRRWQRGLVMIAVVLVCGTCRGRWRRALGQSPLLVGAVNKVVWIQCQGVLELRRSYWVEARCVVEGVQMGRDCWMQLVL